MIQGNKKMDVRDACKILGIEGKITPEKLKKAYQLSCIKYHPDKGGSVEMMQLVNMARESLKGCNENVTIDSSVKQYGDKLNEAINAVRPLDLIIEICGAWVWLSGDTKPHRHIIKLAGFRWTSKKKKWYFRPEDYKSTSRGGWSMDRIRAQYGSQHVDKVMPDKLNHFNFNQEE